MWKLAESVLVCSGPDFMWMDRSRAQKSLVLDGPRSKIKMGMADNEKDERLCTSFTLPVSRVARNGNSYVINAGRLQT